MTFACFCTIDSYTILQGPLIPPMAFTICHDWGLNRLPLDWRPSTITTKPTQLAWSSLLVYVYTVRDKLMAVDFLLPENWARLLARCPWPPCPGGRPLWSRPSCWRRWPRRPRRARPGGRPEGGGESRRTASWWRRRGRVAGTSRDPGSGRNSAPICWRKQRDEIVSRSFPLAPVFIMALYSWCYEYLWYVSCCRKHSCGVFFLYFKCQLARMVWLFQVINPSMV